MKAKQFTELWVDIHCICKKVKASSTFSLLRFNQSHLLQSQSKVNCLITVLKGVYRK